MKDLLQSLHSQVALIITAPPGWGKTYMLLKAIKESQTKVVFIFPLRALCDEVYLSALKSKIEVLNVRTQNDYELFSQKQFQLVLSTPETYREGAFDASYVHILDEMHLFFYWGESFRERMIESFMGITSREFPLILLTATLSNELKEKLVEDLERNYQKIYQLDMGNQQLKNIPEKIYFYPKFMKSWMEDDYKFSSKQGVSLVFCRYREEVKSIAEELKALGYRVLSCVGGEAAQFISQLQQISYLDFIVATSVVSHGVNLPRISRVYISYHVENIDFYLQMLGRGGRQGQEFQVHVMNANYFTRISIWKGFGRILLKRFSNTINSLLY